MCQDSVERFLGRLLTDEDFREHAALSFSIVCFEEGFDLTEEEQQIIQDTNFKEFISLSDKLHKGIKRSGRAFNKTSRS